MPFYDQFPDSSEKLFEHGEVIEFDDAQTALVFRTAGDCVRLGMDSPQAHARDFYGSDQALIETASGNFYGVSSGLVINARTGHVAEFPQQGIDLRINEPAEIPGVGSTTRISALYLASDYNGSPVSPGESRQVAGINPFNGLRSAANQLRASGQYPFPSTARVTVPVE